MPIVKLDGRNEFELTSDPLKENDRRVTVAMRFRCSIRDLFWLTALVAMGIGWWCDHRYTVQQLNFCIEALDQTSQELEQLQAESGQQINSLRHSLTGAEADAARARSNAAMNAELESQFEHAQLWRSNHRSRH
jgi:hypothetical protein